MIPGDFFMSVMFSPYHQHAFDGINFIKVLNDFIVKTSCSHLSYSFFSFDEWVK